MSTIETIQLRRGTAAAWTTANTLLASGEPGFETDTGKLKIGDGSTVWTSLAYVTDKAINAALTGYTSGAGTVGATDSILQAIQKLNGNDATNANLTGPITSVGNATAIAASPILITPVVTGTTSIDVAPHAMTSNTAPAPYVASASSSFGGGAEPFRAFDGSAGSSAYWITAASATGWLQIYLAVAYIATSYAIQVNTIPEPNRAPKNWTLQGSNDGSTWTVLDTQTNQTSWTSGQIRTFTTASPGSYSYYQVNVTANNGDTYLEIAELYLYTEQIANYASNALAAAGGLAAGSVYRNGDNLCVVH